MALFAGFGTLITVIGVAYALILAAAYFFQSYLVYFPVRSVVINPHTIGLDYQDVFLTTEDGVKLHGWFVPAPQARRVVLFLHGNAGNISHRLDSLKIFRHLGVNTFIIDYRGFGRSQGHPSETGTYRDAHAAWRYLVEQRGFAPGQVVIFGRSLGGGVAAWLATQVQAGGLILESSFTSMPDLGAHHYPFLPVRWLSRFRYNTVERLSQIHTPLLVVHSRHDHIVPFGLGQRLYQAAGDPKSLLEIQGGHNSGFLLSGARYTEGLGRFLASLPSG